MELLELGHGMLRQLFPPSFYSDYKPTNTSVLKSQ